MSNSQKILIAAKNICLGILDIKCTNLRRKSYPICSSSQLHKLVSNDKLIGSVEECMLFCSFQSTLWNDIHQLKKHISSLKGSTQVKGRVSDLNCKMVMLKAKQHKEALEIWKELRQIKELVKTSYDLSSSPNNQLSDRTSSTLEDLGRLFPSVPDISSLYIHGTHKKQAQRDNRVVLQDLIPRTKRTFESFEPASTCSSVHDDLLLLSAEELLLLKSLDRSEYHDQRFPLSEQRLFIYDLFNKIESLECYRMENQDANMPSREDSQQPSMWL